MMAFMPAWLQRGFGIGTARVSLVVGLGVGVLGPLATWSVGRLANRLHRGSAAGPLRLAAGLLLVAAVLFLAALTRTTLASATPVAIAAFGVLSLWQGPVLARVQSLVAAPGERPTATALHLLITSILGLALGPVLVGGLSDRLGHGSAHGLGLALRCALIAPLVSAGFLLALARREAKGER